MAKKSRSANNAGGNGKSPTLRSLTRAIGILQVIERSPRGMGLAELARERGLPKVTVLRLALSLVRAGIVARDGDSNRFVQSTAFWTQLAQFLGPAQAFLSDVSDLLQKLSTQERASVLLLLPELKGRTGSYPVYAFPPKQFYVDPSAAPDVPLHTVAGGKCYLAHLSEAELADYMEGGLRGLTEKSITSSSRLERELAAVRRKGYAMNLGEVELSLPGVGVPLVNGDGSVIGGLSLAYAESGYSRRYLVDRVPALKQASRGIGRLLGHESFRKYMDGANLSAPLPRPEPRGDGGSGDKELASFVRSVVRANDLMLVLWHSREGMSVSELAQQRGLDRATVARLLRTLASAHMVRKAPSGGRYHIDPVYWLRLAQSIRTAASLESIVQRVLDRLAHYSGATAMFVCPGSGRARAVTNAYAFPERHVFYRPLPGLTPPLHSVAAGKCWLSHQSTPCCGSQFSPFST